MGDCRCCSVGRTDHPEARACAACVARGVCIGCGGRGAGCGMCGGAGVFAVRPPPTDVYVPRWVHSRMAIGPAPWRAEDVAAIGAYRVGLVVDCQEADLALLWTGTGVRYVQAGVPDAGQDLTDWMRRWAPVVLAHLDGDREARALVHCAAGINRSASLAWCVLRARGVPVGDCERRFRTQAPAAWATGLRYRDDAERAAAGLRREREGRR